MSAELILALQHIEEGSTTMLSYMSRLAQLTDESEPEDIPDALPVMFALFRHISMAAGILEAMIEGQEEPVSPLF